MVIVVEMGILRLVSTPAPVLPPNVPVIRMKITKMVIKVKVSKKAEVEHLNVVSVGCSK